LMIFRDLERGKSLTDTLKFYKVKESDYQQWKQEFQNYSQFRASLLMEFFKQLDYILDNEFHFKNINQKLKDSGYQNSIVNKDFAQRWFNNLDKDKSVKNKQLIGSVYDIGDDDYLLRIEVATLNLHLGLNKYQIIDNKYKIVPMKTKDQKYLVHKFPQLNKLENQLQLRTWGFSGLTIDCQSFIDVTQANIFSAMIDPLNSRTYNHYFRPFLEILKQQP
jgi:hypothetical protein